MRTYIRQTRCRVIRVNSNDVDEGVHVHSSLYHQMSTLLKSIMAAARVTPTYRYYVRKQSPETFVILYRVRIYFFKFVNKPAFEGV